jgi:hypothetical protein
VPSSHSIVDWDTFRTYLSPFNQNPFPITNTREVTISSEARNTDESVHDPSTELDTHATRSYRPYDVGIRAEHQIETIEMLKMLKERVI